MLFRNNTQVIETWPDYIIVVECMYTVCIIHVQSFSFELSKTLLFIIFLFNILLQ